MPHSFTLPAVLHFWPFYVWKWFAPIQPYYCLFFLWHLCFSFHGALSDAWLRLKSKWTEIWCCLDNFKWKVFRSNRSSVWVEDECMKTVTACFYLSVGIWGILKSLNVNVQTWYSFTGPLCWALAALTDILLSCSGPVFSAALGLEAWP